MSSGMKKMNFVCFSFEKKENSNRGLKLTRNRSYRCLYQTITVQPTIAFSSIEARVFLLFPFQHNGHCCT